MKSIRFCSLPKSLSPAAETALDHCWMPFGVQSHPVGPEGRRLCLQPSTGALGGNEWETTLLEVPPGAISPSEMVHSAIIPVGPFTLPQGYTGKILTLSIT